MKSKLLLITGCIAVMGLLAAACGSDEAATPAADPAPAADPPAEAANVGLLFDLTGRGDNSFNDSAAAGLDRATAELGITPSESAPAGEDDRAPRMDLLIQDGQDLVFGVGFLWDGVVSAAAAANPDTNFAIIDSVITSFNNNTPDDDTDDVPLPNVRSLTFAANEGSFLVGVAAALTSTSGKIGFIGGVDFPIIHEFEAGFIAGAKAANPDIEIISQYVSQPPDFGGFTDTAKGKEIGSQMYADGADVVFHAAGLAGNGLFEAASEAGEPGDVWAIGVDGDQFESSSPEVKPYILTSMLKRVDNGVFETINDQTDGAFTGTLEHFDLARDGVGYATSGDFLAADVVTAMEDFKAQIIAGTITVPLDPAAA
jgi:basic membrane protein A